jgi:methyl-accepting chemotaxis protein
LADKYAPATPEIEETIAKLQLPAQTTVDDTLPVPLPKHRTPQSQAQIALLIRDGRRAANKLVASLGETGKAAASSRDTVSQISHVETSMSTTALEQDFTVEDKKGKLQCPFAKDAAANGNK